MISYTIKALKDIWSNAFLNAVTVITIAFSVLIISAFTLVFINACALLESWTRNIRIMAYVQPDVSENGIRLCEQAIRAMPGAREVVFVPREEALDRLKARMKRQASLLDNLEENPLPDAFEIRTDRSLQSDTGIEALAVRIEALEAVEEVEYGQRWLGRFSNVLNLLRLGGYTLGCLFFMAAVFFVANTSRLVLYSRREEMEIMHLVGASDGYIRDPFYIQSLIQGAAGGVIGLMILFAAYKYVLTSMSWVGTIDIFHLRFLSPEILAEFAAGSMFVGWLGCFLALRRFLKFDY